MICSLGVKTASVWFFKTSIETQRDSHKGSITHAIYEAHFFWGEKASFA